jgi:hypothetical protein
LGLKRVVKSGIFGMIFLFLASWLMILKPFDITSNITGGLIQNLEDAVGSLAPFLSFIVGAFLGLILVLIFPIHWCLMYHPDNVMLLISVTLPWILACSTICVKYAKTPGQGIRTSLAIGIGYLILALVIYFILSLNPSVGSIINGLTTGLTDLPYILAVSTAILEGCLVGAVFGGFIGALRYKPAGDSSKQKSKKSKAKFEDDTEPTLEDSHCTNCGAKLVPGNDFCNNCGMKI